MTASTGGSAAPEPDRPLASNSSAADIIREALNAQWIIGGIETPVVPDQARYTALAALVVFEAEIEQARTGGDNVASESEGEVSEPEVSRGYQRDSAEGSGAGLGSVRKADLPSGSLTSTAPALKPELPDLISPVQKVLELRDALLTARSEIAAAIVGAFERTYREDGINYDPDTCYEAADAVLAVVALRAAELRAERAERALWLIKANADSWHGPEGLGSGHDRALHVISEWAEEALLVPRTEKLGGGTAASSEGVAPRGIDSHGITHWHARAAAAERRVEDLTEEFARSQENWFKRAGAAEEGLMLSRGRVEDLTQALTEIAESYPWIEYVDGETVEITGPEVGCPVPPTNRSIARAVLARAAREPNGEDLGGSTAPRESAGGAER